MKRRKSKKCHPIPCLVAYSLDHIDTRLNPSTSRSELKFIK